MTGGAFHRLVQPGEPKARPIMIETIRRLPFILIVAGQAVIAQLIAVGIAVAAQTGSAQAQKGAFKVFFGGDKHFRSNGILRLMTVAAFLTGKRPLQLKSGECMIEFFHPVLPENLLK